MSLDDDIKRIWIACERCNGDGGPASHWDDEALRWEHYVCSSCGGSGYRYEYH